MTIAQILAAKRASKQLFPARPEMLVFDDVVTAALQEAGAVAEEDLDVTVAEEVNKINGERRTVFEEPSAEGKTPLRNSPLSTKQHTDSAHTVKPANLLDLLRDYATVEILRESSVWNLLSLPERIKLNKEYVKQRALSAQEPEALHPETEGGDVAAAETEGSVTRIPPPAVSSITPSESLFLRYPSFNILKESPEYKSMSIADRVLAAREYAKQAQLLAMEAQRTVREGETAMLQAEQAKAIEQGSLEALQHVAEKHEAFALDITLNARQRLGVDYAKAGKSFVFTGAAGTGKTTGCREIARALLERGDLGSHTFKTEDGRRVSSHGIAFCAYTRRATANIRRALHKDPLLERELEENVVTIHRLLEYQPEFYTDPADASKTKMRFIPMRNAGNQLNIRVLVIEEASMLGLDLWEKLYAAMRAGIVLVFVGDINQLPPVFGKSIMNYALAQLPVVELTEVYRQALDSGIIVDAHRVLKGLPPEGNNDVTIVEGTSKFQVGQEKMSRAMGTYFRQLWEKKEYDPNQDIILSPWNKQYMGTDNINNWISQFLGEQRQAMVYEVLTNRRKMYLAVGDRVMYEKQDGIITKISHNAQYLGKMPQPASTALTRFGLRKMAVTDAHTEDFDLAGQAMGYEGINIDEIPDEERKAQASHVITIRLDSGEDETLSSVGDFGEQKFSLGYCLTVHKAQGCEWRKVYILLHKDHTLGGFLSRELLYTAMTRAREKLVIISKKNILAKCVQYQVIKGNTLEEKIASINSGATNIGSYHVTKPRD